MNIIAQSIARIGINYGPQQVGRIGLFGQTQQDGRSGYWRLFFTQMQEESDKKEEKQTASVHGAESVVLSQPTEAIRKKKPQRLIRTVESIIEPVAPFKPLPPFTPQTLQPNPIIDSLRTTQELKLMISQYAQYAIQFTKPLDASNDEEDIELLLLVA